MSGGGEGGGGAHPYTVLSSTIRPYNRHARAATSVDTAISVVACVEQSHGFDEHAVDGCPRPVLMGRKTGTEFMDYRGGGGFRPGTISPGDNFAGDNFARGKFSPPLKSPKPQASMCLAKCLSIFEKKFLSLGLYMPLEDIDVRCGHYSSGTCTWF